MGMLDQIVRTVEVEPLSGKLQQIGALLHRVQDPRDDLTDDQALRAIAEIAGSTRPRADEIYQKPLG